MTNLAIILAGGSGSRMGADVPKQFIEIEGRSIFERSVDAFEAADGIDQVAAVVHPQWTDYARQIVERNTNQKFGCSDVRETENLNQGSGWKKFTRIIDGGNERYMSSLNAIMAFIDMPDDTNIIFHDAARPFVTPQIIARVVDALRTHEAVGVGIPSTDTVWEVRQDFDPQLSKFIVRIPERATVWRAQTPQAFRLPIIRDAFQRALQDPNFRATDDCGVVRRYMPDVKLHVVLGDECNRKITFPSDL